MTNQCDGCTMPISPAWDINIVSSHCWKTPHLQLVGNTTVPLSLNLFDTACDTSFQMIMAM